jgi:hypothetical protein
MKTLHLNLKAEYFDAIARGEKLEEYRLCTPFWERRLVGKAFDRVVLCKGYPKRGDPARTLERPWRGMSIKSITHPHFGDLPVQVFAVRVN